VRGLDTNILLRALTADDAAQSELVRTLFAAAERTGERFFVSIIALCELTWTLRGRPYSLDRDAIGAVVERILSTSLLEVQDRGLVRRALADYQAGRADLADHLLGCQSLAAGCAVTFDRRLDGVAGFSLLA
jgi:predicted nucleic-acid-binding protein